VDELDPPELALGAGRALPLELPPELPRGTAWPLLALLPCVRCCGASSR
jgi:hypothetical protein